MALPAIEQRILSLVQQGRFNQEIAAELNLTHDAVRSQLRLTYARLEARNRTHAVLVAQERGYLDCPRCHKNWTHPTQD